MKHDALLAVQGDPDAPESGYVKAAFMVEYLPTSWREEVGRLSVALHPPYAFDGPAVYRDPGSSDDIYWVSSSGPFYYEGVKYENSQYGVRDLFYAWINKVDQVVEVWIKGG